MWPFRHHSRHRVEPETTQGLDLRRAEKRASPYAPDDRGFLHGLTRTPGTSAYASGSSETEDALRRAADAREGAALPPERDLHR